MNYLLSLEDQTCWVIFIVKASRILGRSQYVGFQGGTKMINALQLPAACCCRPHHSTLCFASQVSGARFT